MSMQTRFSRIAARCSRAAGSPWAFTGTLIAIAIWAASGPFLSFSATWQLIANTVTTLLTTLLVLLIQHTQNRDTAEILAAVRELVRAVPDADEAVLAAASDPTKEPR